MTEFQIPDDVLNPLKERLGLQKDTDVIEAAMTFLNWAAEEVSNGRQIYSANTDGSDVTRLAAIATEKGGKA